MPAPMEDTPPPPFGVITTGPYVRRLQPGGWRGNGTNDWQIIYTFAGVGRIGTTKGDLIVRPGDVVALQPRTLHDYGYYAPESDTWEVRWVHFVPFKEWLPWLQWPQFSPGVLHLYLPSPESRETVMERFLAMQRHARSPLRHAGLLLQTTLQELILHFDRYHPQVGGGPLDERIFRITGYIADHLAERIEVAALARQCLLSKSRFVHLFQKELGKSPQRYIEELRMRHAILMLKATKNPISEIAEESGYPDPLYFSNRFRQFTGMSPRHFRNSHEEWPS